MKKDISVKVEILNDELVVRIPYNDNLKETQNFLDYLRYLEISSKSKANKNDIDILLNDIKKDTWENFKKTRNLDG